MFSSSTGKSDSLKLLHLQVIKMLICVVILFLLCWGPRFIMEFLIKMRLAEFVDYTSYIVRVVLYLLPMVHSLLNPVVYFIMNSTFRNSVVSKYNQCCSSSSCHHQRDHQTQDHLVELKQSQFKGSDQLSPGRNLTMTTCVTIHDQSNAKN